MRSAILDSAMRPVVIVLLDPTSDDARASSKLRYSAVQTSSSFKLRWNLSM